MLDMGTFHALFLVPFAWASLLRGADKKMTRPAVFFLTVFLPLAGWKWGFSANLQGVGEVVCQPGHLSRSENGHALKVQAPPTQRQRFAVYFRFCMAEAKPWRLWARSWLPHRRGLDGEEGNRGWKPSLDRSVYSTVTSDTCSIHPSLTPPVLPTTCRIY